MGVDSILHILIGGLITIFLYFKKFRGITILLILIIVATSKEFYDHNFVLEHCFSICLNEHISDILFSLLFFSLYLPVLSITKQLPSQLSYKYYLVIFSIIALSGTANAWYNNNQNTVKFPTFKVECRYTKRSLW